jgi:TonB-dependent receptor
MRLKSVILSTSSLAILAIAATPASAQTEPPVPADTQVEAQEAPNDPEQGAAQTDDAVQGEGEAIVVTGFRQSLRSAQGVKRNSEQIVDAIVAEDIGKLPDLSVSDTAARIPGVQVVRTGGEASSVLVRGLPDFSTTYNGREIFTAERREVALQDFPSANIAALEVFKTTTANLVEAGLAGQVNVRSRRPFDFRETQLAGSVWGLYTKQAGEWTPNFNLLASTRWDTGIGEMGLLVNVSRTELQFLDSEPSNTDFIADPVINGQRVRFPDVQRLFYRSGNRVRPSVNASFQWRPSDSFEFYAEALYQGFRNKISDRLVAVPLYGGASYSNLVFRNGTNLLESGSITGLGDPIFTFQGGTFNRTNTYQFAVGGIYETGPLKISTDLARTDSRFTGSTESVDRIFAGRGTTAVDFDLTTPQFAIRNFGVSNPNSYLFDGLYEEAQVSEGDDYQARLDATYEFDEGFFVRSLQAGVRYTDRDAHREFGNRFAGFRGRNIPSSALPLDFELNRRGFRGTDVQSGFENFLTPTYRSIRQNRENLRQFVINQGITCCFGTFTTDPPTPNPTATYDATEETIAGYGQINFAFGELVEGAVGLRAVRTQVGVSGTAVAAGVLTPVSAEQEFTDYLPNASVRVRFTPELQLRLSATQTRTRPTFEQLNPAVNVGAPDPTRGGLRTGSGGNPFLQPFNSNNYDASLEYYFSRTGFASAAIFRRDIRGFIQNRTLPDRVDPVLGLVRITGPENARRGRIDGFETQLSTFFDFGLVPEFLRNFGIQANYTYIDDEVEIRDPTTPPGTPDTFIIDRIISPVSGGISKHTFNLTGLYEGGPLSARLTYNKRSNYLDRRDERGDEEGGFYREIANPAGRLDLSVNYTIIENATLFFDWTNITEDPFRVNFSSARRNGPTTFAPRADYVRFLRFEETTFSLGVRFRL